MKKARFLGACLLAFAILLAAWKGTRGAQWYTDGLLVFAGVVGPMMHGWVLETNAPGNYGSPVWVHGSNRVQLSLQFDSLAVGLVPLLALLAATPGLALRRRATLMCAGVALNFLADVLIVALFPLLVFYKNPITDVVGTFLGLIAFVGAPVIIWFALTFRELQESLPSLRPGAKAR
jgi:hypothetical protein